MQDGDKITTSADIDLDVLGDTLTFYIRVLDIAVSRDLDERLKGLEVAKGKGKITTLLLIDRHPGIRPSVLAERIMYDRAQIARIVEAFVKAGLVTRQVAESDNRAAELFVTEKGAALAARVRAVIAEQEREFFDPLISRETHDEVVAVLRGMYARLLERSQG